jgi:CubicO group peptidase (beta-lactamase class C family)
VRISHALSAALVYLWAAIAQAQQVEIVGLPDHPPQEVTEANWSQTSDNMRWMSRNFSVKPSLLIPRGDGLLPLARHPDYDEELLQRSFAVPGTDGGLTLARALSDARVNAYLVLKDGKLLLEQYYNGFHPHMHHSWYSGAKSLIGMAIGLLVEQGRLDVEKTPAFYLPELKDSAYNSISIRQVLNMTTALAYTEDPDALQPGQFRHEYLQRAGMLPPYSVYMQTLDPAQANIPRGVRGLMPLLKPSESVQPGERFDYQNINVDVAGWLIESVAGQRLEQFLSERVWRKLQTEHDAIIPTDPNFTALAAGGFSSTARDAARFGLAVVNGGVLGNEKVFPPGWVADTCRATAADREAFANQVPTPGDFTALGSIYAYKNYWYIQDGEDCAMTSRGFGGQSVYINRARGIVIVTFASSTAAESRAKNRLLYLSHAMAGAL